MSERLGIEILSEVGEEGWGNFGERYGVGG